LSAAPDLGGCLVDGRHHQHSGSWTAPYRAAVSQVQVVYLSIHSLF
jgi:hypothetical protein